jgi:hypothetical protein
VGEGEGQRHSPASAVLSKAAGLSLGSVFCPPQPQAGGAACEFAPKAWETPTPTQLSVWLVPREVLFGPPYVLGGTGA